MKPLQVLSWHGGLSRAADHIKAQADAGVTHVCVPVHHLATAPHVQAILDAGMVVVRKLEPPWNVGREQPNGTRWDLGRVLMEWESPTNPGFFFRGFLESATRLRTPCAGLAWNLEHYPKDYPITPADIAWAKEMHVPHQNPVELRCWQFSLFVRLYRAAAEHRLGTQLPFYAYSLYRGLTTGDGDAQFRYSCSWLLLSRSVAYRGREYRPLDYAVPSWHGITLPARADTSRIPSLHNLGLPFYGPGNEDERWWDYRLVAADRLRVCRERGDAGLAFVAAGRLDQPWGPDDDKLLEVVKETLSEGGL